MTFLLADVERKTLRAIAARLPNGLLPNHLSGIGVLGAVGAGVAYALSTLDPRWLWLASVFLVVNWFGDSLDGTLARVRGIERPRYGYYLDHLIDGFSTAVVGVGIGLSPFVEFELAMALVVVYLMLSINVYLESSVFGVFKMAYGRIGPTEGRILLALGNAALVITSAWKLPLSVLGGWITNGAVAALGVSLLMVLTVRFAKNLHRLSALERISAHVDTQFG